MKIILSIVSEDRLRLVMLSIIPVAESESVQCRIFSLSILIIIEEVHKNHYRGGL